MSAPVVSAVVPVFNDVAHLEQAVEQLLAQVGAPLEVVLVDDGSTDGSRELARGLAEQHDRVTLVEMPQNGGPARAREQGVARAAGEWVWFVDSDDGWPADAAARLLAATDDDVDAVVASARFTYAGGAAPHVVGPAEAWSPIPGAAAFEQLLLGRTTGHLWNKLFRRSVLTGIEYVPAKVQSDLAMTAQALAASRGVAGIPDVVYEYRIRSGSVITKASRRAESLALIEQMIDRVAHRNGLAGRQAHRYFRLRYIVLSGLKDAALGDYSPVERARLRGRLRPQLTVSALLLLLRLRDWRRLLLAVGGRVSDPVHRRLLRIADRH